MDEIVFNDIYDKYVNPVWRTALYYSGNQTDAEEITQLTFIQLLISYETIQNKDAIEAWLLTTARRLVYSRKRKAKLETPMCDVELAGRLEKETPGSDELIFMQEHRRKDIEFTNTMLEELCTAIIPSGMKRWFVLTHWKFRRNRLRRRWEFAWKHSSRCCSEQKSG